MREEQERMRDEEERLKKEEQERNREESERIIQERLEKRERLKSELEDRQSRRLRTQELDDEQTEKEMEERARKAASRPIGVHPDFWNGQYKRKSHYSDYTSQQNLKSNYEKTDDRTDKKNKEKVLNMLLSHPIKGEIYVDGDTKYWRKVILKWINENQSGDSLVVSLQNVISYMRGKGVSFNQNDKLVKYPIKDFFEYYEKTLKGELKKKIELKIQE